MKPPAICYDCAAYFLRRRKQQETPEMTAILEQEIAEAIERLCEDLCSDDDDE